MSLPMNGGFEKSPGLLERFVKRCPLCGGLNVVSQRYCAKCGWGGGFDRRGDVLREAVLALFSGEGENGEAPQVFRCVGFMEGGEDDGGFRDGKEG